MPIFRRHDEAPRERSAEDRERARAERAARRAGRPLPPRDAPVAPTHDFEAGLDEPDENGNGPRAQNAVEAWVEPAEIPKRPADFAPDWEDSLRDVRDDRDHFAGDVAEFAPEPHDAFDDEPRVEDPPHYIAEEPPLEGTVGDEELQPTAPFDPLDPAPEPRGEEPRAEEPRAEEPPPIVPPAARRARTGRKATGLDEAPPPAPRRVERRLPPPPPLPGTPAFTKRRRRRGRILAFVVLLVFVAIAYGANLLFQPFHGEGGEEVTVRIPLNSTKADVGDLLADAGIVDSGLLFSIRARLAGADLKAGTYRLRKDSSYGDVLDDLSGDPATPRTVKVLIPEGRARTETAPLVKEAGLEGSYLNASDAHKGFSTRKYGAPKNTKTLEGFLFPATYELRVGASADQLVGQQLDAFEANIAKVDMKRARKRNLTTYDVLIIASMVEREAQLAKERPIIAAVIQNRMRKGMPLQIDATIRYATRNWTEPIKQSELRMDSAYNTYRHIGLPPTPIGSPGLNSIRAAAKPAKVPYLYYVIKPNGDGAHNFSSTDAEFQEDVEAYNRERERRGGKSPASSDG